MKTLALSAIALAAAATSTPGLRPVPDAISVQLNTVRTPNGGADFDSGGGGPIVHVGGNGDAYVLAGHLDDNGRPVRALCTGTVGSGPLDERAVAESANVWRASLEVLSASMERIVIAVDWSRESVGDDGVRSKVAGDRRTVTLREGESQTLDYVKAEPGSLDCGLGLRVDVRASVVEDERFAESKIRYDLWLVDQTPGHSPEYRHFKATARHGEKVPFTFDPMRWDLPGVTFDDGLGAQAAAAVSGSIRGRIRDDGSVEAILEASRNVGILEAGRRMQGSVGDGGETSLRIAPGETLDLVLPAASGMHTLALDGTWSSVVGAPGMTTAGIMLPGPASGLEVDANRVSVDFAKFLAGHTMSLRLTATPESP